MPKRPSAVLLALVMLATGQIRGDAVPELQASSTICHGGVTPKTFGAADPLVMTYLYYWYDELSLAEPGLALHPPTGQLVDWSSPSWHRRQLADMAEAGVDVALPVYWGTGPTWSLHGLDALVAAREALLAEGPRPPAIGLFFDTNLYATLLADEPGLAELTSEIGFEMLANQIVSFFDRIPPCHWARVDGRPLIFLWRPDTEDGGVLRFEPSTLEALYARLEERLGARPYIVRERTWDRYAKKMDAELETDDAFAWGAALNGPLFVGRTVAVGPGYDDRLLADRPGYVRDRDETREYARDLRTAVTSGAPWLLLETWNELWEATAIADTEEYGRAYLDTTRRYVNVFHQLGQERARDGWVDLGSGDNNYLRWLATAWQEHGTWTIIEGRAATSPLVEPDGAAYFHFALDARLGFSGPGPATVLVEYFDDGEGSFLLEYDSGDPEAPNAGAFKPTPAVTFEQTGRWRVHEFELPDARFERRQYDGQGDFRIKDLPSDSTAGLPPQSDIMTEPPSLSEAGWSHFFGRVIVRTAQSTRPIPLEPESLSLLRREPGHLFELRWRGVEEAAAYLVQLVPAGAPEPPAHGYSLADRQRCQGGPAWSGHGSTQAVALEERCLLEHVPAGWEPTLYRWRVVALDSSGEPLGEWSDWGLLMDEGQ